jgi:predicted RNA-binding protein YlxR (DUF448 family)
LCVSFTGQYGIQKLIKRLPKELFEESFEFVKEDFQKIFSLEFFFLTFKKASFRGVLVEISKMCVQHQTKQKEFLHSMKSLYTTNSIREMLASVNDDFDRYGCQLLISVFDFENIKTLENQFCFF